MASSSPALGQALDFGPAHGNTRRPMNGQSTALTRRNFIGNAAALGAVAGATGLPRLANAAAPSAKRIKLGISTYSYWHFRDPKVSIETVIDKTARLGVEGVDIL
ncbi:MAG: twin-arginine translocation signal domain-containing protein, partial [Verrucomicrobiota bacterium]|nr:twin-arginine translocation signal domain-containing protein [Verrucomicrobiota bacterium]